MHISVKTIFCRNTEGKTQNSVCFWSILNASLRSFKSSPLCGIPRKVRPMTAHVQTLASTVAALSMLPWGFWSPLSLLLGLDCSSEMSICLMGDVIHGGKMNFPFAQRRRRATSASWGIYKCPCQQRPLHKSAVRFFFFSFFLVWHYNLILQPETTSFSFVRNWNAVCCCEEFGHIVAIKLQCPDCQAVLADTHLQHQIENVRV